MAVLIHKKNKNSAMFIGQYINDPSRFQGLLHEWFKEMGIKEFVNIHRSHQKQEFLSR